MNMNEIGTPRKAFGIVWAAELVAPAIYVVIGHSFIKGGAIGAFAAGNSMLLKATLATGAVVFIAGFVFPQMRLNDAAFQKKGGADEAAQYVFTTGLISLGMFETVPLLALVWGFVARDLTYLVPSAVIAMIAIIFIRGQINMSFDRVESLFPNGRG
ncbi:MAG: hypothetical protein BWY28_01373 [bacterium ADurb.Bin236]|nr:MAG: hypothetical protein BWY28_01373 [bacterium ADurb.Bin236]HOY62715.1 hypothetical protein [bacterium]HPN93315.1 hypothetical protein [bacterium]